MGIQKMDSSWGMEEGDALGITLRTSHSGASSFIALAYTSLCLQRNTPGRCLMSQDSLVPVLFHPQAPSTDLMQ